MMSKINLIAVVPTLLLLVLLLVSACVPSMTKRLQQKVRIVDAETGAPLAGATIDLHYFPSAPEAPNPDHPHLVADERGEVILPKRGKDAIWQVQAENYNEQRLSSSAGTLPPRYVANAIDGYTGVIYLYQLPAPQLTILIDETYVGPLTVNLVPAAGFDFVLVDQINQTFAAVEPGANHIQEVAGRRVFTETASASGVVDLVVTPLLYDLSTAQVRIEDGSGVLPYKTLVDPQDRERGVWGEVSEDDKKVHQQIQLFVGTVEEYQKYRNG